ncbi:hypothetical protein EVAR_55326_1 [Eumeta japonica]|uniref:Uncharacterized protein n=1 Tax=Eumeta variegata TaxID=151549 RepID=A0A4C1ZB98_EUMVA|nr:hypothetical protein EVAR_55326_1 [Eumeta japonica]
MPQSMSPQARAGVRSRRRGGCGPTGVSRHPSRCGSRRLRSRHTIYVHRERSQRHSRLAPCRGRADPLSANRDRKRPISIETFTPPWARLFHDSPNAAIE